MLSDGLNRNNLVAGLSAPRSQAPAECYCRLFGHGRRRAVAVSAETVAGYDGQSALPSDLGSTRWNSPIPMPSEKSIGGRIAAGCSSWEGLSHGMIPIAQVRDVK